MNVTAILCRLEQERAAELERLRQCAQLNGAIVEQCEDRSDSDSPVYAEYFQSGGSDAFASLTSFSDDEFHVLWSTTEDVIVSAWTTGRGQKCKVMPKDAFMMTLCVLKHYNTWDERALDFIIATSTFQKMIMRVISLIEQPLYQKFIKSVKMADQRPKTQLFTKYRYALYANDVKFQPSNRLSGRFDQTKRYFSNKHKMYGLKLEASVSSPGICVGLSRCYPGSISDLTMFVQRQDFHLQMLQKSNEELLGEDNGEGWESYSHVGCSC